MGLGGFLLAALKGSFCVGPVSKQWVIVAADILQIDPGCSQNRERTSFCSRRGKIFESEAR